MNTTPTRIALRSAPATHRKTSDFWSMAHRGPIRRLVFWIALTLSIAIALQLITLAFGAPLWLFSPKTGRSVIGALMLFSALLTMAHSNKTAEDYGLAIGDNWGAHFPIGVAAGTLLIAILAALALLMGAHELHLPATSSWLSLLVKAFSGVTFAMITSLAATGFLFGTLLKSSLTPRWAVVISALLFAVLFQSIAAGSGADQSLAAMSMRFFLMLVVAQLRLVTGDIVLSMGFLVGFFSIERLVRKSGLLGDVANSEAAAWLAPNHLLLMSPVLWAVLGLTAVLLALRLRISPPQLDKSRRVSLSFCRVYPFGTMGSLAPIDVWLVQLCKARWRINLVYLPRLAATLASSLVNTIITLPERLILTLILKRNTVPAPVFIVGVHRSGTTLLQNLMSLDPSFVTPTSWQVMNPHGFLFSGWLLRPIYTLLTPWKRPMDAVRFGLSTPNEEEFAIANMSGMSPDWSLRLPRLGPMHDRFAYPDQMTTPERTRWRRLHTSFLQRLTFFNRRRPLLKSPHNTGRVNELATMYPDAEFVHLRRHPEDVFRSNIHIAQTAHVLFQLQDPDPSSNYASRFLSNYRQMEERFYDAAETLDDNRVMEIRYEDLVADPLATIHAIYNRLDMKWSTELEARLGEKIKELSDYKPNSHPPLDDESNRQLQDELCDLIERWRCSDRPLDAPNTPVSAKPTHSESDPLSEPVVRR